VGDALADACGPAESPGEEPTAADASGDTDRSGPFAPAGEAAPEAADGPPDAAAAEAPPEGCAETLAPPDTCGVGEAVTERSSLAAIAAAAARRITSRSGR
jgi:hypothetical protein